MLLSFVRMNFKNNFMKIKMVPSFQIQADFLETWILAAFNFNKFDIAFLFLKGN